jgi:hypothetical protein
MLKEVQEKIQNETPVNWSSTKFDSGQILDIDSVFESALGARGSTDDPKSTGRELQSIHSLITLITEVRHPKNSEDISYKVLLAENYRTLELGLHRNVTSFS